MIAIILVCPVHVGWVVLSFTVVGQHSVPGISYSAYH